jgi:hypothetical protein
MNETDYWRLIEQVWQESLLPHVKVDSYELLKCELTNRPKDDLIHYTQIITSLRGGLITPEHLCAAFLIHEGMMSDDSFLDYTEHVAALPRSVYEDIQACPDRILDHQESKDMLCSELLPFGTLALEVFQDKNGGSEYTLMDDHDAEIASIDIDSISFDEVNGLSCVTPKLCALLVPRLFSLRGEDAFE